MSPKPTRLWPDPATILERSRNIFIAQWDELLRLRRAVIKTSDPDNIHDLRVASRRFRAAMELFYPLLPKGSKAELRKSVRKLTRTLGGMRNVDEALIFFHSQAGTDRSADATLCHALSVRRTRELKRIVKMLKTFDHRALGRKVRKMAAGLNAETITLRNNISVPAYLSEAYLNQYLPVHPLLAGALSPEHRATRHALRIIIKKWRYFLEIVTPILERDYAPLLEQLKEYQSILGRMNDLAEFGLLLNKLKLPPTERTQAEATLLTEDARLLKSFRELSELKPLAASFQI